MSCLWSHKFLARVWLFCTLSRRRTLAHFMAKNRAHTDDGATCWSCVCSHPRCTGVQLTNQVIVCAAPVESGNQSLEYFSLFVALDVGIHFTYIRVWCECHPACVGCVVCRVPCLCAWLVVGLHYIEGWAPAACANGVYLHQLRTRLSTLCTTGRRCLRVRK